MDPGTVHHASEELVFPVVFTQDLDQVDEDDPTHNLITMHVTHIPAMRNIGFGFMMKKT